MDTKSVAERLGYLGLDAEALTLLAELTPVLEAHADEVANGFYRQLLTFPETRRLFLDPAMKDQFVARQRSYVISLSEAPFGDAYLQEWRSAAAMQARAGLGPEWTLRFAVVYFSLLAPLIGREFARDLDKATRAVTALAGRMAFDAEFALEAYIAQHEQGLTYFTRELSDQGQEFQRLLREQAVTLQQTTERAQAAEQFASIATLVAGLAHEIGTPMSVIQGHAKMLEGDVYGADGQWRLQTIQEQIARISRIIHTLLRIAHPRRWRNERVNLAPLVEQTLSFVAERLSSCGVAVKQSLEPEARVIGDVERLQQLFLNLFLNAADAMPEGGELRVELRETGGEVRVWVADTGVGIAANDLERIFEPFFTTKEAGHGNGLGLMVCKGIVADHGGEIRVTSEPGAGTEFTITLRPAGHSTT